MIPGLGQRPSNRAVLRGRVQILRELFTDNVTRGIEAKEVLIRDQSQE